MAWKHTLDTNRLDANWKTMAKVAETLVNRYRTRSLALPEDLFQACMVAVPGILAKWDGERPLTNWAWLPLRKALFVEMRGGALITLPEEKALEIGRREKDRKSLRRAVASLSSQHATDALLDEVHALQERLDRADRNATPPSNLENLQAMAEDTHLDFAKHARRKRLQTALRGLAHSSREQVVLRKVMIQGHSAHAVATELGTSHTTVNTLVAHLRDRLRIRLAGKVDLGSESWEYGDCA
jgi:RNA polymerase sigma factor (sigma-70 family)